MLKFIKQHMASIGSIEIYPMISFLLFFLFFVGMTIWVITSDKKFISKMENLPLEDSEESVKDSKVYNN